MLNVRENIEILKGVMYNLNRPLFKNASFLIHKYESGLALDSFQIKHIADLVETAIKGERK